MLRLYYKGVVTRNDEKTRYEFDFDGQPISLLKRDAIALVSSIPCAMRNCRVAFDSVVLKAKFR